ncbi:MAG: chorismate-binding protein [Chitinophagaceae bacterium]
MSQSSIVYRLPGSNQIQASYIQEGEETFIIHPFDRLKQAIQLKGVSKSVLHSEAKEIIDAWSLPEWTGADVNSVDYTSIVAKAIEQIKAGSFDKVVLARQQLIPSETKVSEVFNSLEQRYPDAFVYAFCIGDMAMLGASPETLLSYENAHLKTEALGGTRTHGVYTEKEYQEHQQIVEYITEGISKLDYTCMVMPVQERVAGKVEHLRSEIVIDSRGLENDLRLLQVLHPTSAVCGMPYEASVKFIKNNEGFDRGFYAGYLGLVKEHTTFKFFVNLRCASFFRGVYVLSAGAGINHLSVPEDELEETNNKFQTIAQCLK